MALSQCAQMMKRKIYGIIRDGNVVTNQQTFEDCIKQLDQCLDIGEHGFIYDSLNLRVWYFESTEDDNLKESFVYALTFQDCSTEDIRILNEQIFVPLSFYKED